ncbi:MAG: hypothetical protein NVV82_13280 [Sporocytophaga sp.]|nr:hypothetical protein [Sporocytophaga sp.]
MLLITPELQLHTTTIVVQGMKNISPEQLNAITTDSNPRDVFEVSFL